MGWKIVLYNCALPDDGPVRSETRRILHINPYPANVENMVSF